MHATLNAPTAGTNSRSCCLGPAALEWAPGPSPVARLGPFVTLPFTSRLELAGYKDGVAAASCAGGRVRVGCVERGEVAGYALGCRDRRQGAHRKGRRHGVVRTGNHNHSRVSSLDLFFEAKTSDETKSQLCFQMAWREAVVLVVFFASRTSRLYFMCNESTTREQQKTRRPNTACHV